MTTPMILVATWADGLFAVSGDGPTQEIAKQQVQGLAPDGLGGTLAIVGRHSLRRRTAGGQWAPVATSEFELSCCMAVRDAIFVGTDDARMLRLVDAAGVLDPVAGFDKVAGRESWYAGSAIVNGQRVGPPLGIRSVTANANGSILFANVHVGGIPRSLDGGRTWQATIDINSDVHEVRAHPEDPDTVAAAAAVGLCISRDAGETWSIEQEGLHATHCYALAFSGDDIFLSASTDPFSAQGRIYRRPNKPHGPLVAVEGGMPDWIEGKADTGCIAANGSSVAVADQAGNLYVSTDFGRTWSCLCRRLPPPSGILIC